MTRVNSIWLPFWKTDRLERPVSGGIKLHEPAPLALIASHKPATTTAQICAAPALSVPRPLMLLPRPEPITVFAVVPDYPPRQFTWRRCPHKITKAEGPERISPEWWSGEEKIPSARDYYRVEDEKGQRFWLYRERIYDKPEERRWFMHGLFP